MRMHVDESRRDDQAAGIDGPPRGDLGSESPTAAIRSPRIATSPMNQGLPVPSTILPPRITMS